MFKSQDGTTLGDVLGSWVLSSGFCRLEAKTTVNMKLCLACSLTTHIHCAQPFCVRHFHIPTGEPDLRCSFNDHVVWSTRAN